MQRILFIHNARQRFVTIDLGLLRERWQVEERFEQGRESNPMAVWRAVQNSSLVFCWFASWHSLFPVWFARLLGKPSLVVIGGYDTANLPEAGYGLQRSTTGRWVSRSIMANATCLLANSQSAKNEAINNARVNPAKIHVVYHGFEPFPMGPLERRERLVITIGNVWQENLLRKGLLPFVQAAQYLPDVQFAHVGKWCDSSINDLKAAASSNVKFVGFLPDEQLQDLCQRAWIYVQASLHEGFGMSLAEAMSSGCIPVATSVGALPEVVGDTGIYSRSNSATDVVTAIQKAFELDGERRQQVRSRIVNEFSLERRRKALHELVDSKLTLP